MRALSLPSLIPARLLAAVVVAAAGLVTADMSLAQQIPRDQIERALEDAPFLTREEQAEERADEALEASLGEARSAPVFGANLFTGAFAASRSTEQDNYPLQEGDKILVRVYGAENIETIEEVDGRGNLFLPGVGPIPVAGRRAGDLQRLIENEVSKTYTSNVRVYSALLSPGSIGVYVTGHVARPGRYLGSPRDDILYFLDQAGGIDRSRGSFRRVELKRRGQAVETFDLYQFLLEGHLPETAIEDGDVIFVAPRGAVVKSAGQVRGAFSFELRDRTASGATLTALSHPLPGVTNVAVQGIRGGVPETRYYDLDEFAGSIVRDGDIVTFREDSIGQSITVVVEANLPGPSLYVVPRDARLSEILALIAIDGSSADPGAIHVKRRSVAVQQKKALNESLNRLERELLAASSITEGQAQVRAAEAELLSRFIDRVKDIEPEGIVSVFNEEGLTDIQLEDGDIVVIPDRSEVVAVAGEVVAPGAFAANADLRVRDYVDRAGGFNRTADRSRIIIRQPDGSSVPVSQSYRPAPGDQILVLPDVSNKTFLLAKDVAQILFQVALMTATVAAI